MRVGVTVNYIVLNHSGECNAPINCNPQYPQYGIHREIIGGLYGGSPTGKVTPSSGAFDTSIFYNSRIV